MSEIVHNKRSMFISLKRVKIENRKQQQKQHRFNIEIEEKEKQKQKQKQEFRILIDFRERFGAQSSDIRNHCVINHNTG